MGTKFRLAENAYSSVEFYTNRTNRQDHSAKQARGIIGARPSQAPFTKEVTYPREEDFGAFLILDEAYGLASKQVGCYCLKIQRETTGEVGFICVEKTKLIPVGE